MFSEDLTKMEQVDSLTSLKPWQLYLEWCFGLCNTWIHLILSRKPAQRNIFQGLCRGTLSCSRRCCMSIVRQETLLFKKHLQITAQIWIPHQISKLKIKELNCEQDKAVISVRLKMQLHARVGILSSAVLYMPKMWYSIWLWFLWNSGHKCGFLTCRCLCGCIQPVSGSPVFLKIWFNGMKTCSFTLCGSHKKKSSPSPLSMVASPTCLHARNWEGKTVQVLRWGLCRRLSPFVRFVSEEGMIR